MEMGAELRRHSWQVFQRGFMLRAAQGRESRIMYFRYLNPQRGPCNVSYPRATGRHASRRRGRPALVDAAQEQRDVESRETTGGLIVV